MTVSVSDLRPDLCLGQLSETFVDFSAYVERLIVYDGVEAFLLEVILHYREAGFDWVVLWLVSSIDDAPNPQLI